MARSDWNTYFIEIAQKAAERATCNRARVGCILVKDHIILATGYNGSLPGQPHCDDVGHLMIDGHCLRTNHSEINAIASAAKYGISLDNSVCYCTHYPCLTCLKALIRAGIKAIYYAEEYRLDDIPEEFKKIIPIIHLKKASSDHILLL